MAGAAAAGCGGGDGPPEQDGPVLGDGDVVLAVVAAVDCPPCAAFHRTVLPRLVERYVRPGDVEIRTILLGDDPRTRAVRGAGDQDRFYDALDAVFARPPRSPGPTVDAAEATREDEALADRLGLDAAPAVLAGEDLGSLRPIRAPNLSEGEVAQALDALTDR